VGVAVSVAVGEVVDVGLGYGVAVGMRVGVGRAGGVCVGAGVRDGVGSGSSDSNETHDSRDTCCWIQRTVTTSVTT
jgi:hypothetical protein